MEILLKLAIVTFFDLAMLVKALQTAIKPESCGAGSRLMSVMFALGFAFQIAAECISGGSYAVTVLSAFGFMLSYISFVFSLAGRGKNDN